MMENKQETGCQDCCIMAKKELPEWLRMVKQSKLLNLIKELEVLFHSRCECCWGKSYQEAEVEVFKSFT